MSKQPLSVTLDPENVLWLKARSRGAKSRSVSETLDRLLSEVRTGRGMAAKARSVRGTVRIDGSDPHLRRADEAVRRLIASSLARRSPSARRPSKTRG